MRITRTRDVDANARVQHTIHARKEIKEKGEKQTRETDKSREGRTTCLSSTAFPPIKLEEDEKDDNLLFCDVNGRDSALA